MKLSQDTIEFEKRLGYSFDQPKLLVEALTHPSMSNIQKRDNQRLEFLGDRVLGLIIAQEVLAKDPAAREGTLAPRFNALVRKETCAEVAQRIDLGAVLKLGRSEMLSGGRRKTALLGDAMEAVIAAIYLDGGFDAAQKVVLNLWQDAVAEVKTDARDPKTALQEWAQARGFPPPKYDMISRSGPDHAPVFEIVVLLENGETETAKAGTKRQAEQSAARALLNRLDSK